MFLWFLISIVTGEESLSTRISSKIVQKINRLGREVPERLENIFVRDEIKNPKAAKRVLVSLATRFGGFHNKTVLKWAKCGSLADKLDAWDDELGRFKPNKDDPVRAFNQIVNKYSQFINGQVLSTCSKPNRSITPSRNLITRLQRLSALVKYHYCKHVNPEYPLCEENKFPERLLPRKQMR